MKKLTTEEFIEKAKAIHGDRYDYSTVEYIDARTQVIIVCKEHGAFKQKAITHLRNHHCSFCAKEKRKQTILDIYGVEYPAQSVTVKEKTKQTNIINHGCEYPTQNQEVREKVKATNIERYGVKCSLHNKEISDKVKETNLERYGVIHAQQNREVREKAKQTNIERYGVEYTFQVDIVKEKIKATNIERYGSEYPTQSHMADILPLIEDKEWLFEQYIVLGKTAVQIAQELGIGDSTVGNYLKLHEIEIKYTVGYSIKCIQWLESIMEQEQIFIQHAGNGGEYSISGTRIRFDGYCEETNTAYEFHGDCFHGNPDLYQCDETPNYFHKQLTAKQLYDATIERENKIKELGFNLITIWENDFNKLKFSQ